jgi:3-deoxy-manno-octulosonate cytidylyltransferase (CMP-KDO synthetase)
MKTICIIPSRINSTRLPRKALLPIRGKPMIQWTYENALRSKNLSQVIVATDSEEIAAVILNIGGKVMMTDSNLQTGSDRVAKVAEYYPDADVIINLQGDEPFIRPSMLDTLISPFLNGDKPEMTTLAYPLTKDKYQMPGTVKVITNVHHDAIYFSRSPIPYNCTDLKACVYNHMGVYAFRYDFLMKYKFLPQTPLEQAERLEQLRALEHGYKIRVCFVSEKTLEINTQDEYEQAERFEYD